MKKLISFFTIALFLCLSINSFAQVSLRFFSQTSGTYTEITGGTVVATATATSGAGGLDDVNYPAQTIPFTFTFNGTGYTSYNISSNGYITFGATLPAPGSPYTPISNPAAYDGAIAGMARDLWGLFRTTGNRTLGSDVLTNVVNFSGVEVGQFITGTGIPGTTTVPQTTIVSFDQGAGTITMSANATSTGTATLITMTSGEIRSETVGAAGSQVHIIQYKNFARFAGANELFDFQIRLYETSNVVEVVYGDFFTLNATSAAPQVGLRGLTNADFNNRTGTDWSASTAGAVNTATMTLNATSLPASGQTYTWGDPPACNITISNLNPTGTIFPGCGTTYAPKVNLLNGGTSDQTGISVNYTVGTYNETVTGLSITAGGNMDVDFPNTLSYTSSDAGVKNVTVTVNSTCNANPEVYVLNTSFEVSPLNPNFGGPVSGYYFANSTPGASCAPDQPGFGWLDTSGSTYLMVDTTVQPEGSAYGMSFFGNRDDGHWRLEIPGTDQIRFAGVNYDSIFISTNGQIGLTLANGNLGRMNSFSPLTLPSASALTPGLFALWFDFSYNESAVTGARISYKTLVTPGEGLVLLITYDRAPRRLPTDSEDYASFQVIIQLSPAPTADGRIIYQYDDSRTGSTFLDKYFSNTMLSHTVGIQTSSTTAIQYRRAVTTTVTTPGPLFTSPVAVAFGPENIPLPVELASFTSTIVANDVNLNWSTSTELNNAGFDIERSVANGSWSRIGNVAGNGTSSSSNNYSFTDRNLATGNYNYRLKQIDLNGNYTYYNLSNEVNVGVPTKFDLSQNYPNPFNPTTKVNYDLPFDSKVSIKIFDMAGKEVATLVNEVKTAGYYTANFNGLNLSSGVYFYRISAEANGQNFVATKKMMLVK